MEARSEFFLRAANRIIHITLITLLATLAGAVTSSPAQDWWPMFHHDNRNEGFSSSPAPSACRNLWSYQTGDLVISSPAIVDGRVYVGSADSKVYCLDAATGAEIWTFFTPDYVVSSPMVDDGKVYFGCCDDNVYAVDAEGNGDGTTDLVWTHTTGASILYSSPCGGNGRVSIGSGDGFIYCLNDTTGDIVWSYDTGSPVYCSPAAGYTYTYIGSDNGNIYCLESCGNGDGTTNVMWVCPTGNRIRSSPALGYDNVYVGSCDGNVYALYGYSVGTADSVWVFPTGAAVTSSPAVGDSCIYVGSDDDNLYCLDAIGNGDGTTDALWIYNVGADIYSSPAVADGKVYVGAEDGYLYCLEAATGSLLWRYETGDNIRSSPAVADGNVYVGSDDGKVYAFGEAWPMFSHDLAHTGFANSVGPDDGEVVWSFTAGGGIRSSPAVVDGRIYFGSNDYNVYCVDEDTEEEIWSFTTGEWVTSSPAVADGRVYVGSRDNNVYCLDAGSGNPIWTYETGGWIWESSPAVADGKVYVGSEDDTLYCLDAEGNGDGTTSVVWTFPTGGSVGSSPAVVDGLVHFCSGDGNIYCVDAETGDEVWSHWIVYDATTESPPAVAGGRVYVGTGDNDLECRDAATGSFIWRFYTWGDVYSSPAIAYGKVYVSSSDSCVYCIPQDDPNEDGHILSDEIIWTYKTGGRVRSSPAVADGKVFVGSNDDTVYCFDAEGNGDGTTTVLWKYGTGDIVICSPAVHDCRVYVGSDDGTLYGFANVYTLDISATEGGDTDPPPGVHSYGCGTEVEVLATSDSCHWFDHWELDCINAGSANPFPIYIDDDHMLIAVFGTYEIPDAAVTGVVASDSSVVGGDTLLIQVTVENQSDTTVTFGVVAPYFTGDPIPSAEEWAEFWAMGDANRDGYVDSLDYNLIGQAMGSTPGSPNWNPDADLNEDLVVDLQDLAIHATYNGYDIWTFNSLPPPQPATQRGCRLGPDSIAVLDFEWDTAPIPGDDYVIEAYATYIPCEIDTADNIFTDGTVTVVPLSGVGEPAGPDLPEVFSLAQNRPNPFTPWTEIRYDLPVRCRVKLDIFNVLGQCVVTLVEGYQDPGYRTIAWDARDQTGTEVAGGTYFYRLRAGTYEKVRKMVLLK